MKADKEFFDILRKEVEGLQPSKQELDPKLQMEAYANKKVGHAIKVTQEIMKETVIRQKDNIISSLQEKIEGLESQLSIMKKANDELVNKNKNLTALVDYYENPPLPPEMEEDEGKPIEMPLDSLLAIPVIANYAKDACDIQDAKAIKMMLRELVRNPSKGDEEAISGILTDFIEPQKKPTSVKIEHKYEEGAQHNDHSKHLNVNSDEDGAQKLIDKI